MASLTFTVEGSVSARITVTEVGGDLVFTVDLTSVTGTVGDLRALFFDVSNEALLSGLSVTGTDVTGQVFSANKVKTLGGDANINGQVVNELGAFDAGVEFGTPGMAANDIRSTQFILSHSTVDLTLALITQQDFGIRITSVGTEGGARNDSLKLGGEAPSAPSAPPDAVDDALATNEDDAISGNVLANDADPDGATLTVTAVAGGSVGSAFAVTSSGGRVGQLMIAANGAFTFSPLGNFDGLAIGETDTITIGYTASDGTASDTAALTITIAGTNDAPLITAETGDSAGATVPETNAGLNASGTLTASDVDVSDVISASVVGVTHSGPVGSLSDSDLLGYFQVTSGPLDTTATTSGQLTWAFNSGTQAFDFLAVGETLTLHYTIRPDDGHGPSFVGDGVVTIHVTGTNDAPVVTGGDTTGAALEDGALVAAGTLTASDIDNGATLTWSVDGGVSIVPSDFEIGIDQLKVTKGSTVVFEDNFSDGAPPPSLANDAGAPFATSYGVNNGVSVVEVGGRAILDYAQGVPTDLIGTPEPGVFSGFNLNSNVNPSDSVNGLKLATDFQVEGRFDLTVPDDSREAYGIRLADRQLGGPGSPPDQLGDDVVDLIVRRDLVGDITVTLRELDFATETVINIESITLAPPVGADQIVLRLTHAANAQTVQASFDYLSGGAVVGTQSFSSSASIFTNETWTRLQVFASAAEQAGSVLDNHYGTPTIDQSGNWTYTLADDRTNVQALAEGQTAIDTFTVQVTDEHGASASEIVNVTVAGSNDAPIIESGSPTQPVVRNVAEIADAAPGENAAVHGATGLIAFLDRDLTDAHSAVVTELGSGYRGTLTAAVTTDTTGGHRGYVTWSFTVADGALDDLAQGQTLVQNYVVSVDDGHGGTASRTVRVNITGTNDAPEITSGPGSATVTENGASIAAGTMAAFDPDDGAEELWTVVGGTGAAPASYHFEMDRLTVTKNGAPFFEDTFADGLAPPSSPNFANGDPTTYGLNGGFQETGDRLIIDSADAIVGVSVGTTSPLISNTALVRSNIDPANLARGLKSDDNFTVDGLFDLILPDSPRETYGIRLTDRLVGGPGTPPDQLGDDAIELVVRMGQDGVVRVQLREIDFANDQVVNIGGIPINPPPGADQILLRLTHSTTDVGALHASFDYLSGGLVIGSASLAQIGRIFGTETPGFAGDDENWTRAQVVAYAPAITDSTLAGAYGTLTIDQAGVWTYSLDNTRTVVQNLAAGETAIDTFTVQVADEHGAIDTETINITVTGSNDAPVVATPDVSRTLTEDGALTATGDAFFFDIDLNDTHTIAPSLVSATLSDGADVSAGLLAAVGNALSTTLTDPATGDSDGHYEWSFALDNALAQFLADGQSLTLVYDIAATDNHGASDTQAVTITIDGAADAVPQLPTFVDDAFLIL
jgi:VCBS repeat-containing protein